MPPVRSADGCILTGAVDAELALWAGPRAAHWGARTWDGPERVVRGRAGCCWGNARRAAAADPALDYVEGIVQRGPEFDPELHGWCLDRDTGGVVEVTGPIYAGAVSYKGVVLDPSAVEEFLDGGDRRGHWGLATMLGEVHAEPPAVLFILMDELSHGVRSDMATWAVWRAMRRPAGVHHTAAGSPGPEPAMVAAWAERLLPPDQP